MEKYLISVIVPIYNNEKFLGRCVQSIINQSYKNLEIILIDDGSTDLTPKICDQYRAKDNRIKVVHKKNGGVAKARNKGLNVSNGDYIAFVDSDDYIEKEFCEILLTNAINYEADIIQCGYYRTTEKGEILSKERLEFDIIEGTYNLSIYYARGDNCTNHVWNKLFSKKAIKNIEFPNTVVSEDFAFNVKSYYNSDKSIIISDILYFYVDNLNSVTNSDFNIKKLDSIKIGKKMFEFHKTRYKSVCSFFALYIVRYSMLYYKKVYESSINNKELILETLRGYFLEYLIQIRGKALLYIINKKTLLSIILFLINPIIYIYFFKFKNKIF